MRNMSKDEVLAVIEKETGHPVTEETSVSDLDCDSLEFMNLLVQLGIPDAAIDQLKTVGDIAAKAA